MLNSVILNGRLVKEIKLESYGKGKNAGNYCNFTLAVSRGVKDEEGNDTVDFIDCTAFNGTAEVLNKFVEKGDMVTVSGRLAVNKYTNKDGENRNRYSVIVGNIDLLPNARNSKKNKK